MKNKELTFLLNEESDPIFQSPQVLNKLLILKDVLGEFRQEGYHLFKVNDGVYLKKEGTMRAAILLMKAINGYDRQNNG